MIILTNTTDNIQLVLATSATTTQLQCISSWRDITTTTHTAGRTVTNSNNITDVNIVPAPASSTQRVVDYISIFNSDTVTATITIKFDANSTEYKIFKCALATNEKLEYTDENGWKVINATNGSVKTTVNQGTNTDSGTMSTVVLGSDVANSTTSYADVTGLNFPVVANSTYTFRALVSYTAALTTTGSRWSVNGGSLTFSNLNYSSRYTLTSTSETANGGVTAFDSPAAANASSLTDGNLAVIEGNITVTSAGTVAIRFASEVGASAITAKAGSVLYYQKLL